MLPFSFCRRDKPRVTLVRSKWLFRQSWAFETESPNVQVVEKRGCLLVAASAANYCRQGTPLAIVETPLSRGSGAMAKVKTPRYNQCSVFVDFIPIDEVRRGLAY